MADFLFRIGKPILHALDPETAHAVTIMALKSGLIPSVPAEDDPALKVNLWNHTFTNPVGLAAGFDKGAAVLAPMLRMGFGFVEAGTVTPRPQPGNPRPRIFRCAAREAVINRMGFPGAGMEPFKKNMEKFLSARPRPPGLVGINIGMNKGQREPAKDYCQLIRALGPYADYFVINISSPNTPGLRDLQSREPFLELIGKAMDERRRSCGTASPPPLLVKLSPDLRQPQCEELAKAALESGIDGLVLTNTTLDRPGDLPPDFVMEAGGLSGKPLHARSTETIRAFYALTEGKLPIVGAGGISSAQEAYDKIRAGASLVQLYSALIYHGPDLVGAIKTDLAALLRRDGFASVADAVGADHKKNNKAA